MLRPIGRRLVPVVAALVALILAHDLAFLARYGSAYGEALAHAGHGPAWTGAVVGSVLLGGGLLVTAIARLFRLHRLASRTGAGPVSGEPLVRDFIRAWWVTAFRFAILIGALLTLQENVERMAIGLAGPNVGLLLSPEYPSAPAIVLAVALVVAFVAALVGWRHEVLAVRVRAVRAAPRRRAPAWRPAAALGRRPQPFVRGLPALRAPPLAQAIIART